MMMPELNFKHLRYTTIRGDEKGPHLLILAGVHGDEYEPIAAVMKLMNIVPDILTCGKVTLVPVVNEVAFKNASRCGEDGLDLARICPGNKQGTTTEIIAAEISELISTSDYLIDLHTGGNNYEIVPLCGYMLHSKKRVLDKQHQMALAFDVKTIWGTSGLDGRTLSVARDHDIPAIYAESGGGRGFKKPVVKEYVRGCLNVMAALEISEGRLTSVRSEYIVKEYYEGSGHLQRKLPSPSEGFFEAEVKLGDFITKGEVIGTLSDPFSHSVSSVCADQDGMVFFLRAIPSVKKGDSLGGILPITKSGEVTIS